jgi:hypothetical protein
MERCTGPSFMEGYNDPIAGSPLSLEVVTSTVETGCRTRASSTFESTSQTPQLMVPYVQNIYDN